MEVKAVSMRPGRITVVTESTTVSINTRLVEWAEVEKIRHYLGGGEWDSGYYQVNIAFSSGQARHFQFTDKEAAQEMFIELTSSMRQ